MADELGNAEAGADRAKAQKVPVQSVRRGPAANVRGTLHQTINSGLIKRL